jgi:hypothetical protein
MPAGSVFLQFSNLKSNKKWLLFYQLVNNGITLKKPESPLFMPGFAHFLYSGRMKGVCNALRRGSFPQPTDALRLENTGIGASKRLENW